MGKVYGIVFPTQKAQIDAWCWGSCGHGICGAIDLGFGAASLVPCRQGSCPHLDRQTPEPVGEADGDELYLRKLLPVKE